MSESGLGRVCASSRSLSANRQPAQGRTNAVCIRDNEVILEWASSFRFEVDRT